MGADRFARTAGSVMLQPAVDTGYVYTYGLLIRFPIPFQPLITVVNNVFNI